MFLCAVFSLRQYRKTAVIDFGQQCTFRQPPLARYDLAKYAKVVETYQL